MRLTLYNNNEYVHISALYKLHYDMAKMQKSV